MRKKPQKSIVLAQKNIKPRKLYIVKRILHIIEG